MSSKLRQQIVDIESELESARAHVERLRTRLRDKKRQHRLAQDKDARAVGVTKRPRERQNQARYRQLPTGRVRSGNSDRYAVSSKDLAKYIKEYKDTITVLAQTSQVSFRTISRILNGETKFTTLQVADELLTALGVAHVLGDKIAIVANPSHKFNEHLEDIDC